MSAMAAQLHIDRLLETTLKRGASELRLEPNRVSQTHALDLAVLERIQQWLKPDALDHR